MTIFSYRAECQSDVDAFIGVAKSGMVEMQILAFADKAYPDVDIEITTEASKDALMDLMRRIDDAHIMRQTLRALPLKKNSLERDFKVK